MTKLKILSLIIILSLFSDDIICQEKDEDTQFDFGSSTEFVEIPEEFLGENAVIIYNEEIFESDFDADYFTRLALYSNQTDSKNYNYNSIYTGYSGLLSYKLHKRVRILTKKGLSQYSFVSIPNNKYSEIVLLDARTIKPDGTIQELEVEDIKEVDISTTSSSLGLYGVAQKRFAIPGVEVGDEIEIVYKVKLHNLLLVEDFYLHSELPILHSKLTIRLRSGLYPHLYYFNGAVHAETKIDGNFVKYSWESNNLPGYNNTKNARISSELPFVRLVLKEVKYRVETIESTITIMPDSWETVFDIINSSFRKEEVRNNRSHYIKAKIKEIKQKNPEASKFDTFYTFFRYVNDSVEVRTLKEWEENNMPGYYLFKGFINHEKLYNLYIKAFKIIDLDYNLVLAVDKHEAQIDTTIINPFGFSEYLFQIHDGDKSYLLYPSTKRRKYEFDEIPASIEGTKALILIKGKNSSKVSFVVLPQGTSNDNFINRRCKLNIKSDTTLVESTFGYTLSGAMSTKYRNAIDRNIDKFKTDSIDILKSVLIAKSDEIEFKVDTIIMDDFSVLYPFKYKFTALGSYNDILTNIADSTYTLSLSVLLKHNILHYSNNNRLLDYIPDYPYTDMFSYFIVFDKQVKMLNGDALLYNIENKVGKYQLNIKAINNTMLLITSKYQINLNYITKEDYGLLIELSKAAEDAKDATLLIRF